MADPIETSSIGDDTNQLASISKVITTLAAVLIVLLGLQYIARDLIAPLLMAFFLAILIRPLFNFYRRKGVSSDGSIAFVFITIVVLFIGLIILLTHSVSILQDSLSQYTQELRNSLTHATNGLNIDEETSELITRSISPENITRLASTVMGSLGGIVLYLFVVPILAMLIVLQLDSIPKEVSQKMVDENPKLGTLSKFADSLMIYVAGRFKVNLITGILFAISLLILGVDFPFFWGGMTVFLSFVPYVGMILAAASPTLIALANQGTLVALAVIGSAVIINLVTENVLDPIIQGKNNKLSPAVIIAAIIFWSWILGPVGMILSAPLTVFLKLIFAQYHETAWMAQVIEGDFSGIPSKTKASASTLTKFKKSITSYFSPN